MSIARFTPSRAGRVEVTLDPTHSYAGHRGHQWASRDPRDLRLQLSNGTVWDSGVYHLSVAAALTINGAPIGTAGRLEPSGVLRFSLAVTPRDRIELRVALSTVDTVSARATLDREVGDRTLASLAAQTRTQ